MLFLAWTPARQPSGGTVGTIFLGDLLISALRLLHVCTSKLSNLKVHPGECNV
jgi:hypothetical protein